MQTAASVRVTHPFRVTEPRASRVPSVSTAFAALVAACATESPTLINAARATYALALTQAARRVR